VGIGTTSPAKKLTLGGTGAVFGVDNNSVFEAKNSIGAYEGYLWPRASDDKTYINYGASGLSIRDNTSWEYMAIDSIGRVKIGHNITAATGYLLNVGGKVIAEEVRIALMANWPDYVFEKNHKLISIEEVESQIEKNKHLPGLPTACEVEENGIMLGEIQAKTIEKVEELTLYIIQLKKENNELTKRIEALEKK
jgi:hypothetical protein